MGNSHGNGWRRLLRGGLLMLGLAGVLNAAQASLVNFEGFADNFTLTSEVAGVQFSSGTVLTAGVGLNEIEFPPHSGDNVLAGLSGGLSLNFGSAVNSLSLWFTHGSPLSFLGLDASSVVIASIVTPSASNLGAFDKYSFAGAGLKTLFITSQDGSNFVIDDLVFTANAIPEAPGWSMAALGLALLAGSQRRARTRRSGH